MLIAVKSLANAKTRLARDFASAERQQLVLAMFRDTVSAARGAEQVASITVVTPDDAVAVAAEELDAGVVPEPVDTVGAGSGNARLNLALAHAAAHVRANGATDLVALQADLPALTTAELSDAIAATPAGARSFVADHQFVGTAALFARNHPAHNGLSRSAAMRSRTVDLAPAFGHDSARKHLDSGARALIGEWPGLRLDVDTPDDLELAYRIGVGPQTRSNLEMFGWTASLENDRS
ncbi:2-phospho-L-lactate guanylyltransferase [Antrihabitans cavernicola]|uniref:Phosphoenolpyruvate guanylyltransferase n=1 Tax=Antrihabitans cavernicola TaxID=2495913 RepID=A0A5A7SI36_9NOCA|nr:2-phospho-L-lactate guanylyltransferase [Spelaeibacter cavernicola]